MPARGQTAPPTWPRSRGSCSDDTACVVVGYPNFFGCVGDLRKLADPAHEKGALLVTATSEPFALALLEPPGALGADIAVGEGQPLGLPPQYGGPGCGLFACRTRASSCSKIPGRLCGETVDKNGQRGYVLTLATREQHIRRERATSNICTNHGLCALAITIRVCLLGKQRLRRGGQAVPREGGVPEERARRRPARGSCRTRRRRSTSSSSARRRGRSRRLVEAAKKQGVLAGVALSRWYPKDDRDLLIAVTERHGRADLDRLVKALG